MSNSRHDDLIIQYQQLLEHYRTLDRQAWQVPSVAIAIFGGIVVAAFKCIADPAAASIVLLIGVFFCFSLLIAVVKYRYFQRRFLKKIREIEEELKLLKFPLLTQGKEQQFAEHSEEPTGLEKLSSGIWLIRILRIAVVCLIVLFFWRILKEIFGGENMKICLIASVNLIIGFGFIALLIIIGTYIISLFINRWPSKKTIILKGLVSVLEKEKDPKNLDRLYHKERYEKKNPTDQNSNSKLQDKESE